MDKETPLIRTADGAGAFLGCPDCGCHQFAERTSQTALQRGIRFDSKGHADMDSAGDVELSPYVVHLYYQCEGCGTPCSVLRTEGGGYIATIVGVEGYAEDYLIPQGYRVLKTTGCISQGEILAEKESASDQSLDRKEGCS